MVAFLGVSPIDLNGSFFRVGLGLGYEIFMSCPCYNMLYVGLPLTMVWRLQLLQNAKAREVTGARWTDSMAPQGGAGGSSCTRWQALGEQQAELDTCG